MIRLVIEYPTTWKTHLVERDSIQIRNGGVLSFLEYTKNDDESWTETMVALAPGRWLSARASEETG